MSPLEAKEYGLIDNVVTSRGEIVADEVKDKKIER
jgi:ATP-dependent protease ClpP protease subunit